MSLELPTPDEARPPRSPGSGSPPRTPVRLGKRLARLGLELGTVFVGVYAAFLLNSYQAHRQERHRREQILAWMESAFVARLADVKQERTNIKKQADEFNRQVEAGEMPMLYAVNWSSDYDPTDMTSVLGSGGFDLLEVETVRQIKDSESTLREMISLIRHNQQLSDALILPNLERDHTFFYDPDTRKLRPTYRWYAELYRRLLEGYDSLEPEVERLLTQIRADRQRHR